VQESRRTGSGDGERIAEEYTAQFIFIFLLFIYLLFCERVWFNSRKLNVRMMRLHCLSLSQRNLNTVMKAINIDWGMWEQSLNKMHVDLQKSELTTGAEKCIMRSLIKCNIL
jgi:hypothetical protein